MDVQLKLFARSVLFVSCLCVHLTFFVLYLAFFVVAPPRPCLPVPSRMPARTTGLAVITGLKYPSRVAIQALIELYGKYSEQFGLQAKSATTNSLTKKSKPVLQAMCKKYDDLSKVDKTSALIGKVDEVKVQMQDNISAMLKNTEQAESLAERSDQLNEQASVFKKKSTDLRKQMRCKNLKMTIILTLLVVGVLAIILVPLIMKARNK